MYDSLIASIINLVNLVILLIYQMELCTSKIKWRLVEVAIIYTVFLGKNNIRTY